MRRALGLLACILTACGGAGEPDDGPGLVAFGSSTTTITLAWTLPGPAGFTLERRSAGAEYVPLATLPPGATGYLDRGLPAGELAYRLRAIGDDGPGLERSASPGDEPALRTEDEPVLGAPVEETIGQAGGVVTADDGRTTVTFDPGSLPDGTGVTLRRFVSPMGGDPGLEVSTSARLDGPMRIAFGYDELDALSPDALGVVVREADGTWITQPFDLDAAARTATLVVDAETTPGARPAAGGRSTKRALVLRARAIEPRRAIVPPNGMVRLVAYAHFSDFPCDQRDLPSSVGCQMIALAIDPRVLLRPVMERKQQYANLEAGYERDWLVEDVLTGNATFGRIFAAAVGADYTAPAVTPPRNPVDVKYTSVRVDGATRTPEAPLHAAITVANPRWRGSLSCVVSASGTESSAGGTTTTVIDSSVSATAEDTPMQAFSMTITSAQASYTRTITIDQEVGTITCPVHHRYVYQESASIAAAGANDLVSLIADDTTGQYMLFSGFGGDVIGTTTGTRTYTATGDPMICPRPPMNEVIPGTFAPNWMCGSLGTYTPSSNRIHEDTTVHDQENPPGTTHVRFDFTRQ